MGNLRVGKVVGALLLDPEAFSAPGEEVEGTLREPVVSSGGRFAAVG